MRLFLLVVIFLGSCASNSGVPSGVLPPEKMKPVLFDIIRADEFASNYIANDSTKDVAKERKQLYQKVFVLHKTDQQEFYNSLRYYEQHPEINKMLFDSLLTYANKIRDKGLPLKPVKKEKLN